MKRLMATLLLLVTVAGCVDDNADSEPVIEPTTCPESPFEHPEVRSVPALGHHGQQVGMPIEVRILLQQGPRVVPRSGNHVDVADHRGDPQVALAGLRVACKRADDADAPVLCLAQGTLFGALLDAHVLAELL